MADKFKYIQTSPEQIQKCLNCEKPFCNDCRPAKRATKCSREELQTLWKEGKTAKEIAFILNVNLNTIYRVHKELGIEPNR